MNYGKTSYSLIKITAQIEVSKVTLFAEVNIPAPPKGILIMALTSSQEHKNTALINELLKNQFGVVVVKLFTNQELNQNSDLNNLNLMTERLVAVTRWVKKVFAEGEMSIGLWGFGKGAAAALRTSVELKEMVKIVIAREGRVDLAQDILEQVASPTLLIVDELNKELIKLNKIAQESTEFFTKLLIVRNELNSSKIDFNEAQESVKWIGENINKEILCY